MSIATLVEDLHTDEVAWASVQAAHQQVIDARTERQRLTRMLDTVCTEERDALTRLTVALTVIRNRQEGKL